MKAKSKTELENIKNAPLKAANEQKIMESTNMANVKTNETTLVNKRRTAVKKPITPRQRLELTYKFVNKRIKEIIIDNEKPGENEIDISSYYERSTLTLGSYVTLDWDHKNDITDIISKIKRYSFDKTQKRPLNFLMAAEPGSGKSHFVKSLAKKINNVSYVNFNMATFRKPEDFIYSLENVRNLKVQDQLPILFIDEFDSNLDNFALLLPLLWDGEMQLSNREIKLGKIIIILAGSNEEIIKIIAKIKKMEALTSEESKIPKIKDLLSRINGGDFEIPKLELHSVNRDRRVDKVCLSLALLKNRFGLDLEVVPWALLNFISKTKFSYGVRSIAQFIDLIPFSEDNGKILSVENLKIPLTTHHLLKKSILRYHLNIPDDDAIEEIVLRWNKAIKHKTLVRFVKKDEEDDDIQI